MKAMILAAGLGTRLRPITNELPKALIKIQGKTLLEIAINHLSRYGFKNIIINVHHFAEKVIEFTRNKNFNSDISFSDESEKLLDTGGGLKKASWFFDDGQPFLLYNVDIISNLDLKKLYVIHEHSESLATLAIRKRDSSRYLLFDDNKRLHGWENVNTGEMIAIDKLEPYDKFAFSGIHFLSSTIFSLMPDDDFFSMIDLYLSVMNKHIISGYYDKDSFWLDAGKPEGLEMAKQNYYKFINNDPI